MVSALILASVFNLGAMYVTPTWISGPEDYIAVPFDDPEEYGSYFYSGMVNGFCLWSAMRWFNPESPCSNSSGQGFRFRRAGNAPGDDMPPLYPIVVLQASTKHSGVGRMVYASLVWGSTAGSVENCPPACQDPGYNTSGYRYVYSPYQGGVCYPSGQVASLVALAVCRLRDEQDLDVFMFGDMIVTEHGTEGHCQTWVSKEDINEFCEIINPPPPPVEGEAEGINPGDGGEEPVVDTEGWKGERYDPSIVDCTGPTLPTAEEGIAFPIMGYGAQYADINNSAACAGDTLDFALINQNPPAMTAGGNPAYQGLFQFYPSGSPCPPPEGAEVEINGVMHQYSPLPDGNWTKMWAGAIFGYGGSDDSTFSFYPAQLHPKSVLFCYGNVVPEAQICGLGQIIDFGATGIPAGGEACSWKALDGTVIGYKLRAQKTRLAIPAGTGSIANLKMGWTEDFFWVQKVVYPRQVDRAYSGMRIWIDDPSSPAMGYEKAHGVWEGTTVPTEPGWYRFYTTRYDIEQAQDPTYEFTLAPPSVPSGSLNSFTNSFIEPAELPGGFNGHNGGSGSGGVITQAVQILDSNGNPVGSFGLSKADMIAAQAQGTAIGIDIAGNGLASKIASAIETGLLNASQGSPASAGAAALGNLSFDGSGAGGGSTPSTGHDEEGTTPQDAVWDMSGGVEGVPALNSQRNDITGMLAPFQVETSQPFNHSFTIPWFNGETQTIVLDQSLMPSQFQTWVAHIRAFVHAILLLGFVVVAVWFHFRPLLLEGWTGERSGS